MVSVAFGIYARAENPSPARRPALSPITLSHKLATEPRNADLWLERGRRLASSGKDPEALFDFDQAIKLSPRRADAYIERARLFRRQKAYALAVADYTKALTLDPPLGSLYLERGRTYVKQKRYDDALADLSRAARLLPEDPKPVRLAADVYTYQKKYTQALKEYQRAKRRGAGAAVFHISLCQYYLKQYDHALRTVNGMIQKNSGHVSAHYLRGIILTQLERYEDAISAFTRCLQLRPTMNRVHYNRAVCYLRLRKWETALNEVYLGLHRSPNSAGLHRLRGRALRGLSLYPEAVHAYDRAIELTPNHRDGYTGRAMSYALNQNHWYALRDLKQAHSLDPEWTGFFGMRGFILCFFHDYRRAAENFKRFLRSHPREAYEHFFLLTASVHIGPPAYRQSLDLLRKNADGFKKPWARTIAHYFLDRVNSARLLELADGDREKQCEAYFYIAVRAMHEQRRQRAKDYLERTLATGVTYFYEYTQAAVELSRL